jgi:CBS domain containing-hemolysin-like protein
VSPLAVLVLTVVLIVACAVFVAAEFSLLATKRHRLEDLAAGSRSARAALRSYGELTVLLAGCQLGITASALGLGAVTKPAVHYALTPAFETWGMPYWVADTAGFVLALLVVTFLHLVIGEMAPKSWAIAHPERSAIMLALFMRGFMAVTRPLLLAMNAAANWLLRRVGVEPQDSVASGQTPDDLRQLVEHSAEVGAIDAAGAAQLTMALDLQELTVADLVRTGADPTSVPTGASVADVQQATRSSGHLRILVRDGAAVEGVVHVRDTLGRDASGATTDLVRPVLELDAATPVHEALTTMRETRQHLAVVTGLGAGPAVVTLADVLGRLFPGRESGRVPAPAG